MTGMLVKQIKRIFNLLPVGLLMALCMMPFSVAYAATTSGIAGTGGTDFSTSYSAGSTCVSCHATVSTYPTIANAANAGNVVTFMNTTHSMGGLFTGSPTTIANDIAAYIASLVTTTATNIPVTYNTPTANVVTNIYTATPSPTNSYTDVIDTIETVSGLTPTKGTVSFVGNAPATITYTPTSGACLTDSFTYQGRAATGTMGTTSQRAMTVAIGNPPVPTVNTGQAGSGVFGTSATQFTLAQTSVQSSTLCGATRFSATTVAYGGAYTSTTGACPPGLTLNTTTGAISGTPSAAGTYSSVPVCAINPGGSTCVNVSITISQAQPTISTPTIAPATLVAGGSSTLSATSSNGAALTYSTVSASSICTISGTTVTGVGLGNCAVTASQVADANNLGATSGTLNITVGTGAQTIVFGTAPATVVVNPTTSTGTVSASTKSSANLTLATTPQSTLVYSAAAGTGNCTVNSSTGAVTGTAAGTCAITATQSGVNANYSTAAAVPQTVTVGKGAQTVSFTTSLPSITVNGTGSVPATSYVGNPATATTTALAVTYGSSTPSACTINASGVVKGIAFGTNNCTITAAQAGDANYNAATTATQILSIGLAAQNITFGTAPNSIVYSPTNLSTGSVSATATSGLAVTYSVIAGGTGNCTVNSSTGAVVGTAGGTCIIAANQGGDGVTWGAAGQVTQTVTVGTIGQNITFGAAPTSVVVNSTASTGTVSATTSSGLAVSYSAAAGTGSCSVNAATGAITGLAAGTCIITATQAGSANYSAATSATQTVTVGLGAQTITFATAPTLAYGGAPGTVTANSYINGTTTSSGLTISFSSTTPTVCTVSGTSLVGQASTANVSIVAAGTCIIAADQSGNANYNGAAQQTQTITISRGSQTIALGAMPAVTVGTSGSVVGTATTGLTVAYSSLTPLTCTVNATTGLVTGIAAGACTIAVNQSGSANYAAAPQVTQNITVGKGTQTISFGTPPKIWIGITGTVTATSNVGLAVSLNSTTPAVCTISGTTVTGISAGTCTITADQTGDANYTAATQVALNFRVMYAPPLVVAATMSVQLNTATKLDLAKYITGINGLAGTDSHSGITGVSIAVQPTHGAVTVAGTWVTYVPKPDYFGTDSFEYFAYGADNQVSATTGKVTVTINGRPDPTKDARVLGLINAEGAAIKRFGMAQVFNFQQRLESRHHAVYAPSAVAATPTPAPAPSGGTPVPVGGASPSSQGRGYFNSWQPGTALAYENDPNVLLHTAQLSGDGQAPASNPMYGVLMNAMAGALTTSTLNLGTISNAVGSIPSDEFSKLEIWAAGNLRFGTSSQSGMDSKFTTDGISVGADKRMDRKLTLGIGMGYARDKSSIGSDGTNSSATGNSVAGYASYMMDSGNFLDVLLGYGKVNFDTNRYVVAANDVARKTRTGDQIFGSFAFGYEYRKEGLLWSPYGRYDFSYDRLNVGTESGAGINALSYASQNLRSSHLAFGMRAQSVHQTDFGVVQPHARFEYQRGFESSGQTSVAYADMLDTQYVVAGTSQNTNAFVLGLGNTFVVSDTLRLTLDYQRLRSAGFENYQSINLRFTKTIKGKNDLASLLDEGYDASITKPTGITVAASFGFEDNVSRSSDAVDKRSDTIYGLTVNKALSMLPTKFTRLTVSGFMDVEKFRNYAGLGHVSVGAQGEYAYRFSGDFGSPTIGIFARYTADEYESQLRDGNRRSVGVNLRKALTDRINLFMAVANNVRNGKSDVFNTRDNSGRMNLDYDLAPGHTLYLTGEYRKGDIVSSGQPSLKVVDSSIVLIRDDVFTAPWFYDYRMKGKTGLMTLGYNLSLGTKDSLDFSWRHVKSAPDNVPAFVKSMQYFDNLFSVSYLMAF